MREMNRRTQVNAIDRIQIVCTFVSKRFQHRFHLTKFDAIDFCLSNYYELRMNIAVSLITASLFVDRYHTLELNFSEIIFGRLFWFLFS